jgi:hypothetical protein
MSDHGWDGGEWPDDLDPDGGGLGPDTPDPGPDLSPDLGSDFGADLGEAQTADLSDTPDGPDPTPDAPLDPAGDSTVDGAFDPAGQDSGAGGPDAAPDDGGDTTADGTPEPTPVGADPDLDPHADTWTDQSFPEPLDLDAPEPVDGFPWTDPATLGTAPLPDADAAYQGGPEAGELAAYAGEDLPPGTDPWTALSASEDPATSSLARWWSPGT